MTKPIFRVSGEYFGFIRGNNLFNLSNVFIGRISKNEIWKQNGQYLGEIFEESYILRQIEITKENKKPFVYPILNELPQIAPARVLKTIPNGFIDALELISEKPFHL